MEWRYSRWLRAQTLDPRKPWFENLLSLAGWVSLVGSLKPSYAPDFASVKRDDGDNIYHIVIGEIKWVNFYKALDM